MMLKNGPNLHLNIVDFHENFPIAWIINNAQHICVAMFKERRFDPQRNTRRELVMRYGKRTAFIT